MATCELIQIRQSKTQRRVWTIDKEHESGAGIFRSFGLDLHMSTILKIQNYGVNSTPLCCACVNAVKRENLLL